MKTRVFFSVALLPFLLLLIAHPKKKVVVEPQSENFVAHEWGTFTTLHASDGGRLSGLERSEEVLPPFVYQHAPKLGVYGYGNKGGLKLASNVSVKMETPVIYFYSDKEMKVSVKADFPKGSINEWYPQRSGGENDSEGHDFAMPFKGWINWDATILAPGAQVPLSPPKEQETPVWTSPRVPEANLVKSNGEVENFLFYRGIGNFDIPVDVKFTTENTLSVQNNCTAGIPYVFIYEKTTEGESHIWWSGELAEGTQKNILISENSGAGAPEEFQNFERALVQAGLYADEAKAMLKTWDHSYFKSPGLKVFWIVPEQLVNKILPLSISPRPKEVKRVFVGRCDVLTPKFEEELLSSASKIWDFWDDRYLQGYKQRVAQLHAEKLQNAIVGWDLKK